MKDGAGNHKITWNGGHLLRLIRLYGNPKLAGLFEAVLRIHRSAFRRCEICGGSERLTPTYIIGRASRVNAKRTTTFMLRYNSWACLECVRESNMDGSGR